KLYHYIDGNPAFCFRSADYMRDPATVGGQKNVVTVGPACEVDLAGQVRAHCPEVALPGAGGEMDFMPGITRAPAGKMIVAMESARSDGASSRIVPHFRDGAVVGALCSDVHYVVTEHGVAYLHGKSLQERAIALISIAHPDFRAGLLREAIEHSHVSADLAGIEGSIRVGPPPLRSSMALGDGTVVSFRPMHPTDEPRMHELFHSLSQQTMYYRFMADVTRLPQRMLQNFVYIDYRDEMAIVGTLPEAHGEEIIAVGRYYLIPETNRAEVAFIVRDPWQNRGIGTFLLKYLATIAKSQGIVGFSAEVLAENKAMLAVLQHTDFRVRTRMEGRVRSIELDFE
ncbi:MAG: GNAT family N-acetyltransferase, partial [Planctomycetota bacterium]